MSLANEPLFKSFIKAISNKSKKKDKVLILCSGGADSMLCTQLCLSFFHKINIRVVYYDHQLRNTEKDIKLIQNFCNQNNLALSIKKLPIKAYQSRYKCSVQSAGHYCRKSFSRHLCNLYKIKTIISGHHQDDDFETRLLSAKQGTLYPEKLSYAYQDNSIKILKPLLKFKKQEILNINKTYEIQFNEDPSNKESCYMRNHIRHHLIPTLIKKNKDYYDDLCRLQKKEAKIINKKNKKISQLSIKIFSNQEIQYQKIELQKLDPETLFLTIKKGLKKLYSYKQKKKILPPPPQLSKHHQNRIFEYVKKNQAKTISMPNNIHIQLSKKHLHVSLNCTQKNVKTYLINYHTNYLIENFRFLWQTKPSNPLKKNQHLLMFPKKINTPLILRKINKTDKIIPYSRKNEIIALKYLKKKQVPKEIRENVWILTNKIEILCIIGHTINEKYKVANPKDNHLLLEISLL